MRRRTLYDGDTFEVRGYTFKFSTERDDDMGEPWKEHDGHGLVSDWTRRDKAPGERVLVEDHCAKRFYDFAGTVKLARKDGWGCEHSYCYNVGRNVFVSGHNTPGELAQCAAEQDYRRMRGWCQDDWYWLSVRVVLVEEDEDGTKVETDEVEYLSGIESDAGDYLDTVAHELADQILERVEVESPDAVLSEN